MSKAEFVRDKRCPMNRNIVIGIGLVALLIAVIPGRAHHSFTAVFDAESPLSLTGTVTEVEWMNPHTWFYVDVADRVGEVENWGFEMGSPNGLIRRGWNHNSLQVGEAVTVEGFRAKDGTMRGAVRSGTLATGERLCGAQDETN